MRAPECIPYPPQHTFLSLCSHPLEVIRDYWFHTYSYLQIIYWTLFAIQVIAAAMLTKHKKGILTIVLLAIFPLYNTLYPILQNFITAFSLFPTP